ncbi:MAG: protein kinase, partial [Phycisphaerae bacterium]
LGYEILGEIHRGGQGVVYKAIQEATQRVVALKVLLHESFASEQSRQRFEREIQLVAGLGHPNIVTIYDSGLAQGCYYFAMEYIEGQRLSEYFAGPRRGAVETLALISQISAAIGYAHRHGVVHRDLKPGNILIDSAGQPHIVDFGLAKAAKRGHGPDRPTLTAPGDVLGTPSYMAPEQFRGDPSGVDARCDVYALGVIIYECLTGRLPRDAECVMAALVTGDMDPGPSPPAPSRLRRDLDSAIDTMTLKCLALAPDRRYADAQELAAELDRYLAGQPILAKRSSLVYRGRTTLRRGVSRHPLGALVVVAVLAIVAGNYLLRSGHWVRHPDRWFESAVQPFLRPVHEGGWADAVTVVTLDDQTFDAIPALANAQGLTGVEQSNLVSWRRLHGQLMRRLAQAKPAVVGWDIVFGSSQPEHDPALVEGIRALQTASTQVIVGFRKLDQANRPVLSPAVLAVADGWGWITLFRSSGLIRSTLLAATNPPEPPGLSLSLAAFAAWQHAGCKPRVVWDVDRSWLRITYTESGGPADGPKRWLQDTDRILIGEKVLEWEDGAVSGVDVSDRHAACSWTVVPSKDVLASHSLSYGRVFRLTDVEIRDHFDGKIVVIGDTRDRTSTRPDKSKLDDGHGGREEFHVFMHASAICDRLNQVSARRPGLVAELSLVAFFAVIGTLWGACLHRPGRRLLFWTASGLLSAAILAASFGAAVSLGVLPSPATAVLTFWLALVGAVWARRTAFRARPAIPPSVASGGSQAHFTLP